MQLKDFPLWSEDVMWKVGKVLLFLILSIHKSVFLTSNLQRRNTFKLRYFKIEKLRDFLFNFQGELPLKYLPSNFYRYEMSNCLFEAAYEQILIDCNCTPSFHQVNFSKYFIEYETSLMKILPTPDCLKF